MSSVTMLRHTVICGEKRINCVLVFNYLCNMVVITLHNTSYSHPNVIQINIFFLLHWVDLQWAVIVITSPGSNLYISTFHPDRIFSRLKWFLHWHLPRITIFCGVKPYSLAATVSTSKKFCLIMTVDIFMPWRERQQISPKHWYLFIKL